MSGAPSVSGSFSSSILLTFVSMFSPSSYFVGNSLNGLNKFLGGLFGALKYALIISVLINVFDSLNQKFRFMTEDKQLTSVTYHPLLNLAPELWDEAMQYHEENEAKQTEQ